MDGVLSLDRVAELSDDDRAALRQLSAAVYPPVEWADWPGRNIEWAAAEWCVRVWDSEGALASHIGIVLRQASVDGKRVRIGGVGGVKTHPATRGRGYAGLGMRRAVEFFREDPAVAFAVLVCAPHLIGYYSRLGWQEFAGRLLVRQHGKPEVFTFNRVMVCSVQTEAPTAGDIDLLGPPW